MSALAGFHAVDIGCLEQRQETRPAFAVPGLLRQMAGAESRAQPQLLSAPEQQPGADSGSLEYIMSAQPPADGARLGRRRGQGRPCDAIEIGEILAGRLGHRESRPATRVCLEHGFRRAPERVTCHKVSLVLAQVREAADEIVKLLVYGPGGLAQVVAQRGQMQGRRSFGEVDL